MKGHRWRVAWFAQPCHPLLFFLPGEDSHGDRGSVGGQTKVCASHREVSRQ